MTDFEQETPRKIGRYEVIRKIATGGMAELFLARFVGPGGFEKRCALKRILPQFAADKTFTRMFLTEARVTAMFDHPNLVQIFELGQDDEGQFYIAMELVNGMNLRQLLHLCREKGQLLPAELVAYMMTQALDGLAYAHDFKDGEGRPLHLVHRDISPQNLLVSYEGAVKIVDFGIVKGSSISGETLAGMLKGKVAYMSPEQASGEAIDARSDLFSMGVCMFEMIAGEKPFTGPNEIMCLKSILEDAPPPLTMYAPDCPDGIEGVTYRALEKNREQRYANAREFQLELQAILKDCPTPLGRHVIADFLRSLTEAGTDSFDPMRLRIPRASSQPGPRSSPRFAHSVSSVSLAPVAAEITGTQTPSLDSVSNPRIAPSLTMDGTGLTAEIHAAGIRRMNPVIMLVFAASAIAGGLVVWLLTSRNDPVVIELLEQPTGSMPPKTRSAGAVTSAPPVVKPAVAPPPDAGLAVAAPVAEGGAVAARADGIAPVPLVDAKPALPAKPVTNTGSSLDERRARRGARAKEKRKAPARLSETDNAGTLTLTSSPRGLTVTLESKTLGTTPLIGVIVPAGAHTLRLTNKSLGISKKMTVKIVKGSLTEESLSIGQGTLKVMSRPWSEVFVDGAPLGKTPLNTPLYEGVHEVKLVNEAKENIQKIEISPGKTETVRVVF